MAWLDEHPNANSAEFRFRFNHRLDQVQGIMEAEHRQIMSLHSSIAAGEHRLGPQHPWYVVQALLRRSEAGDTIYLDQFPAGYHTSARMCIFSGLLNHLSLHGINTLQDANAKDISSLLTEEITWPLHTRDLLQQMATEVVCECQQHWSTNRKVLWIFTTYHQNSSRCVDCCRFHDIVLQARSQDSRQECIDVHD